MSAGDVAHLFKLLADALQRALDGALGPPHLRADLGGVVALEAQGEHVALAVFEAAHYLLDGFRQARGMRRGRVRGNGKIGAAGFAAHVAAAGVEVFGAVAAFAQRDDRQQRPARIKPR